MNEVDEFLEHHGIKGMHWGIRKEKRPFSKTNPHASRNKKIAVGIGAGLAVATGAFVVKHYLGLHGAKPVAEISKVSQKALDRDRVSNLIGINAKKKMSAIQAAQSSGKITPEQEKRLLALVSRDRSNAHVRDFYDRFSN